ncbi:UDP-N-acetylglucosamine acyltransferase [Microbacterium sp. BWT-B31]|uniref:UDP-N-acetylglucosamine acyltransferase n=1 Tax=Microbacterium sp. BWT-B31 TaxID=3232072 RepID=UPI0035287E76
MNDIHPTAVIGEGVRLGRGNTIGPFVVLTGDVVIGDDNWIGTGVVIGAPPEVRTFDHPRAAGDDPGAGVVLGSGNVIREYAQIHAGLKSPTSIGDAGFIMNQVYIAHDGRVGNGVTMASSVLLAGHATVGDGANLGLGTKVHQFRSVGAGAMVGMGALVTRDIPAFALAYGAPARVVGANRVGLQRQHVDASLVERIHRAYLSGEVPDLVGADLPDHIARALSGAS